MKNFKKALAALLLGALALSLAACGASDAEPTPDPHEGMIYVNTGAGEEWVDEAEGVPVSQLTADDFETGEDGIPVYTGDLYETRLGIDVSFYQGDIDWQAVADSGVKFAMIRCGYRGSSEGELFVDEKFEQNMQGAIDAGLDVGVYFFSQSTGAIEGAEEALFVLDLIKDYKITMPVAFDWEPLEESRAEDILDEELTASAIVFCEMVKDAGYTPCVYFYRYIAYHDYDLSRLADYMFWIGAPGSTLDFYYEADIWQFSFTSRIDGIDADVDMNLQFYAPGTEPSFPEPEPSTSPEPTESPEPAESAEPTESAEPAEG